MPYLVYIISPSASTTKNLTKFLTLSRATRASGAYEFDNMGGL